MATRRRSSAIGSSNQPPNDRVNSSSIARVPLSLHLARAGAGEMRCVMIGPLADVPLLPVLAGPGEPAVLLLIEHVQRLVAQLGELGAPAGAAADRAVVEDRADDVDLLAVVHLIPERLQHLADRRRVGVAAVHQPRHVGQADVAGLQLFVIEDADAAVARDLVALEREVHLLDAVALGAGAERRLRPGRAAAEQNAFVTIHLCVSPSRAIIASDMEPTTLPRRRIDRGLLPRLQDRPDAHGGRGRRRRTADPRRLRLLPQRAQLSRRRARSALEPGASGARARTRHGAQRRARVGRTRSAATREGTVPHRQRTRKDRSADDARPRRRPRTAAPPHHPRGGRHHRRWRRPTSGAAARSSCARARRASGKDAGRSRRSFTRS